MFKTQRLYTKQAEPTKENINFLVKMHNDFKVMELVGFPKGLGTTFEKEEKITRENLNTDDARLFVYKKENDEFIGYCKIGKPTKDGFYEIDYKLLPEFWGRGYGSEILRGLVDYIFKVKGYSGIQTTPNKNNIASQKICEKVGMRKVGEGVSKANRENMVDVFYYIYRIGREEYSG